jgi:hypothetical protein
MACDSSAPCIMSTIIFVSHIRAYASTCRSLCPPTARLGHAVAALHARHGGAGLTDHVWTLREVLLYRVPLWPQPAGV